MENHEFEIISLLILFLDNARNATESEAVCMSRRLRTWQQVVAQLVGNPVSHPRPAMILNLDNLFGHKDYVINICLVLLGNF